MQTPTQLNPMQQPETEWSPAFCGPFSPAEDRILVAEDDPVLLSFYEKVLGAAGFLVTSCRNGAEAWSLFQREFHPIILLDWLMPEMDGLELCRRIRAGANGAVPIVLVITGCDRPEHLVEVMAAGADDYIPKPIDAKRLQIRLAIAARRSRSRRRRLEAEADLRKQRDWFEITLASIGDAVITTSPSGCVTYLNHEAERLTGWSLDEAHRKPVEAVFFMVGGDDLSPLESPVRCALRSEEGLVLPRQALLYDRQSGRTPIDGSCAPLQFQEGSRAGAVLVFRDISERVRQERNLLDTVRRVQQGKEEWETTANALSEVVCLLDESGRLIRANKAVEQWTLRRAQDLKGLDLHQVFHASCTDSRCHWKRLWSNHQAALAEGRHVEIEMEDACLQSYFHVQLRPIRPMSSKEEAEHHKSWAVAVVEDITERKRMEIALQRAREQEIDIGWKIQQALLIGSPPQDLEGIGVAALTVPSQRIDGDFYLFFRHSDKCLDIVVGDVMGKGIPAALIGAAAKSHFLSALSRLIAQSQGRGLPRPEEVVAAVHGQITERLMELESFVTLCYARFDMERREALLVDCGHPRALLCRGATGECLPLPGENLPLGFSKEDCFRPVRASLEEGDLLLFYSDGVIEARSAAAGRAKAELFGEERLARILAECRGDDPEAIVRRIRRTVADFTGRCGISDDLTCIAVRIGAGAGGRSEPLARSRLRIVSDLSQLKPLRGFLKGFLDEARASGLFDEQEAAQLEVAVVETVTNVIRHAYRGRWGLPVWLQATRWPDRAEVRILHRGAAFDPAAAPPPALEDFRQGGIGLYIIDHCVDEVIHGRDERGRARITLIKRKKALRGADPAP